MLATIAAVSSTVTVHGLRGALGVARVLRTGFLVHLVYVLDRSPFAIDPPLLPIRCLTRTSTRYTLRCQSLAELQRGDLFEAHGRVFTLRQVFATVVELQARERRLFWIAGVAL